MWPFALLSLVCLPIIAFVASLRMQKFMGNAESAGQDNDGKQHLGTATNTNPGAIVLETLLNIRTVSALTLEKEKFEAYKSVLLKQQNRSREENTKNRNKKLFWNSFLSG